MLPQPQPPVMFGPGHAGVWSDHPSVIRAVAAAEAGSAAADGSEGSGWFHASMEDGPACPSALPPAGALDATQGPVAAALAAITANAQSLMNASKVPGLSLTVVHRGRVVMQKGLGLANATHATPVTPTSGFRLGSISKILTSLALWALDEQGVVRKDDALSKWVPELVMQDPYADGSGKAVQPEITLRQLATFTSGLPREGCIALPSVAGGYGCGILLGDNETAIFDAMGRGRLINPMWTKTPVYSNFGFSLLGLALNRAVAASAAAPEKGLYEWWANNVATPLGMRMTGVNFTQAVEDAFAWSPPSPQNDALRFFDYAFSNPAGGMFSTGADMARLASYLLSAFEPVPPPPRAAPSPGGGGGVTGLSLSNVREYMRPATMLAGGASGFGTGYAVERLGAPANTWAHIKGGAVTGYSSNMALAPELGLAVVVLGSANFDPSMITVPALQTLAPLARSATRANATATYNGSYVYSTITATVTATADAGLTLELSVQPGRPYRLVSNGVRHQFYLTLAASSCWLDEVLMDSNAGGPGLFGNDLVFFEVDAASGVASAATLPEKDITLKRTPSGSN